MVFYFLYFNNFILRKGNNYPIIKESIHYVNQLLEKLL